MPKKLLALILLVTSYALLVTDCPAQSDSITFTTYYPSPYGVYRRLRIHPSTPDAGSGPTLSCTNPGELYFDSTDNTLYVCSGSPPAGPVWTAVGSGTGGFWAANLNDIYNINTGNVGIGTTAPETNLHINDQQSAGLILEADNPETNEANHPSITLRQDGGRIDATVGFGGPFPAAGTQNTLRIMTHESGGGTIGGITLGNLEQEQLTILPDGKVGIGTTNPGVELHVKSIGAVPNGDIAIQPSTPRLWTMSVTPDGRWELHYLTAGTSYNGVNDYVPVRVFAEGGGQADTLVVRGGSVGIRASTPPSTLSVGGHIWASDTPIGGHDAFVMYKPDNNVDPASRFYFRKGNPPNLGSAGNPGVDLMVITNSGDVGIGTATPAKKLHVVGGIKATGGIDPPFISFTSESHESIKQFAKNVSKDEKVMQFWNGEAHRLEVYIIDEDRFYTITGGLIEN